ncbi:hypothetical protein [Vulgatibacter sp.]|uniref:hypothetical protein n=1 Tax=Vulgatibacter sp. TaxID=1971226 RepID=UPI0035648E93
MPENDAFSRDLGYLDKFFDKLEEHAGTLPSDAGQRLRSLLSEERTRWAEIRKLVGAGGAPAPAAAAGTEASTARPEGAPAAAPPAAERPPEVHPYTRAMQVGLAQLPREAAPPIRPPAGMGGPTGDGSARNYSSPSGLTVGSLKPRR